MAQAVQTSGILPLFSRMCVPRVIHPTSVRPGPGNVAGIPPRECLSAVPTRTSTSRAVGVGDECQLDGRSATHHPAASQRRENAPFSSSNTKRSRRLNSWPSPPDLGTPPSAAPTPSHALPGRGIQTRRPSVPGSGHDHHVGGGADWRPGAASWPPRTRRTDTCGNRGRPPTTACHGARDHAGLAGRRHDPSEGGAGAL